MRLLPVTVAFLVGLSRLGAAQAWDPAPLQSPTPTPKDGLPAERSAFIQWLQQNLDKLSETDVQRARERVYVYISEIAKANLGAFPSPRDSSSIRLFQMAATLGVIGADQIAAALAPAAKMPRLPLPPGLTLSLQPPLLSLASDDSTWALCFPYYFMAAPAGRQTPANGVTTEIAVISTLFAADRGPATSSQATILILAAPIPDSLEHITFWVRQLHLAARPGASGSPGQWYAMSSDQPMRGEAIVRRLPRRIVLIAYMGLPGTFETNRPHFLNLLRTLAPSHCAA